MRFRHGLRALGVVGVAFAAAFFVLVVYLDRRVGLWAGVIALVVAGPIGAILGRTTRRRSRDHG
jgi:hypothetical protein